jgi:hypothetical protein
MMGPISNLGNKHYGFIYLARWFQAANDVYVPWRISTANAGLTFKFQPILFCR